MYGETACLPEKFHVTPMRLVIQRVLNASVSVNGVQISRIERGLLVFVGITTGDNDKDSHFWSLGLESTIAIAVGQRLPFGFPDANKLLNVRLWPQGDKAWAKSCKDNGYEVLIVSQFTLYGIFKGNKPDFHNAMPPAAARVFYDEFVKKVKQLYKPDKIQGSSLSSDFLVSASRQRLIFAIEGEFGAMMEVSLVNDGPVTMQLDSRKWTYVDNERKADEKNGEQKTVKPTNTNDVTDAEAIMDSETKC